MKQCSVCRRVRPEYYLLPYAKNDGTHVLVCNHDKRECMAIFVKYWATYEQMIAVQNFVWELGGTPM